MPLQQFHPTESLPVRPPRNFNALWGWGGRRRGVRLPIQPLTSHASVQHVPAPAHSCTAQFAFPAWKEPCPFLLEASPACSQPSKRPVPGEDCLQGHSAATHPKCSGETEASPPLSPSVTVWAKQSRFHAPRGELKLGVESGASLGAISYNHADQGHYLSQKALRLSESL